MNAAYPWSPVKVGWLSGVSRPGTNALSPEQRAFVEALPGDICSKLTTNFPYGDEATAFVPTPLVLASAVNLARFAAATTPWTRGSRAAAWRGVKASCERLLLVTGSCGSQIVASLERGCPAGARVSVLALGSVDWGLAGLDVQRVRGDRDMVARRRGEIVVGVGHMDYTRSTRVLEIARLWVRERLQP